MRTLMSRSTMRGRDIFCIWRVCSLIGSMSGSREIVLYEVRPGKDRRGVDLISDVLPFGRLWYGDPNAVASAIGYAEHFSRSHDTVIRVYDAAGNVIGNARTRGRVQRA